jgi:hypothetical protein
VASGPGAQQGAAVRQQVRARGVLTCREWGGGLSISKLSQAGGVKGAARTSGRDQAVDE